VKTLLLLAIAIALPGCAERVAPGIYSTAAQVSARADLARVCPTPTHQTLYDDIAGEIERSTNAGAAPDTLATEWERLNNGAQICGEGR
jgi:hypothetical protein